MNANSRVEGKKKLEKEKGGGRKVEDGGDLEFWEKGGKGRQSGSTRTGVTDVPSWPPGAERLSGREKGECSLYMNAIQLPRVDAWERS